MRQRPGLALISILLATAPEAHACATCGCSLSSDGATGFWTLAGWRLSLQYDFLDQDQLRRSTGAVSPAQVAALNSPFPGAGQEVEHQTINRYLTLGLSYSPDSEWNVKLLVPYIDRSHTTYGAASNPLMADQLSAATAAGLGDLKVIASYQGFLPERNLGVQLGVKLPTGRYGGRNADAGPVVGRGPVSFGPAGNSGGMLLDTSLQAGSGSTDLILGAYYFRPVSDDLSAFANAQFQAAVAERLDQPGSDYRPGNQGTLSLGLRYEVNPRVVPQLQVNLNHRSQDQGALADTADTAGTVLYLSPGVNAGVAEGLRVFAFAQLPILSNLSGYQLFPRWTASVGLTYHF
jgi:hypothetical protein